MGAVEQDKWVYERKGGSDGPEEGFTEEEKRTHPAARPGTGDTVIWRNEQHRISPSVRCLHCGWYQDDFYNGFCACGAHNWEDTSPPSERPEPPRQRIHERSTDAHSIARPGSMESLPYLTDAPRGTREEPRPLGDGSRRLIVDQYPGSAVAEALGGIARGMVVMLAGAAGVGKTTLAAQAGYTVARQLGRRLYWLDADQLSEELIVEAFVRAQCPLKALEGGVIPIHEEDEDGLPDFKQAFAWVPADGVMIVDSLETWAPRSDKQELELLRELRVHPARVKLVVVATNAAGEVAGDGALKRAGDATVYVDQTSLRVRKCRWRLDSDWARCGTGGLQVERIGAAGEECNAAQPERVPQTQPSDEAPLSERTMAAYARLKRLWPWRGPVRASEIVRDLRSPGLEELGAALRELLGASEGSILNANEVGNALKAVRDVGLDGMKLTRDLDRKGIASWRWTSCNVT